MSTQPAIDPAVCPISRCAELVCGKWTVLVIRDLLAGPKYFRELERSLAGISPRTLCERLKFLTERGVVTRTYIKALPPRAQYALTDLGLALRPLLDTMRDIGDAHLAVLDSDADASSIAGADDCGCSSTDADVETQEAGVVAAATGGSVDDDCGC